MVLLLYTSSVDIRTRGQRAIWDFRALMQNVPPPKYSLQFDDNQQNNDPDHSFTSGHTSYAVYSLLSCVSRQETLEI